MASAEVQTAHLPITGVIWRTVANACWQGNVHRNDIKRSHHPAAVLQLSSHSRRVDLALRAQNRAVFRDIKHNRAGPAL